jgi:uncharacterized protein YjbJ (UPF0337 family)
MGELKEEIKGTGQQIKGKVKEETGDLLDDRTMETEGNLEKNEGKLRRDIARPMSEENIDRNVDKVESEIDPDRDRY